MKKIILLIILLLSCKGNTSGETCLRQQFLVLGNSEVRNIEPVCTKKLLWYATLPGIANDGTKYTGSVKCFGQVVDTSKSLRLTKFNGELIDIGTKLNFKEIDCAIIGTSPEPE